MAEQTAGTFTQSPATSQFVELYGIVQNYILAPLDATATTQAKRWINDAIRALNNRNWSWVRATSSAITFLSGEGGREYQLPTNFKAPRSFELLDAASRIVGKLPYRDPKTFDDEYQDRSGAPPEAYTIFNVFDNGYLTLSGPPTAGFLSQNPTGRLRYYRRIPHLSADSDLIAAPSECEAFVLWRACADAAAFYAPARVAYADKRANETWRALVNADAKNELTDWA